MGLETLGVGYHIGQVRPVNQDALAVLVPDRGEQGVLLVVADGMGGHQGGQIASSRVVSDLGHWFQSPEVAEWVQRLPADLPGESLTSALHEQLVKSNAELYAWGQRAAELESMGTTATVAWVYRNTLAISHIGDSRAYLWRQGQLHRLTEDHSWVADEVRQGRMTEEQAEQDSRRNRLLRSLGTRPHAELDSRLCDIQLGDLLLLCSDGLTNYVNDRELCQWLEYTQSEQPQTLADGLVNQTLERGGGDNVSVIVARLSPAPGSAVHHTAIIRRHLSPSYEEGMATVMYPAENTSSPERPSHVWFVLGLICWALAVLGWTASFTGWGGAAWSLYFRAIAAICFGLSLATLYGWRHGLAASN